MSRLPLCDYREQHAADWSAYIKRLDSHRWLVVFAGEQHSCWFTRREARVFTRSLKSGQPL